MGHRKHEKRKQNFKPRDSFGSKNPGPHPLKNPIMIKKTRKCSYCQKKKNLNKFYPNRTEPLKIRYSCIECEAIKQKARYSKLEGQKKIDHIARIIKWRQENRARIKLRRQILAREAKAIGNNTPDPLFALRINP